MPSTIVEYKCLMISPSDVGSERDEVANVVRFWNAHNGEAVGVSVRLVAWETDATPDLAQSGQDTINQQLVEQCDLGIAVFWTRIGSPTLRYDSGSVEEIEQLLQRKARVMAYFSSADLPQNRFDPDQYARLKKLKATLLEKGLCATYSSVDMLKTLLMGHLTSAIDKLIKLNTPKTPREAIQVASDRLRISPEDASTHETSIKEIASYLLASDPGVARNALANLIKLVDDGVIPVTDLAIVRKTNIRWDIRKSVVKRISAELPAIALPLLMRFTSSGYHEVQTEVRKPLLAVIEDSSSPLTLLEQALDILNKMNQADITEPTRSKNNRAIAKCKEAIKLHNSQ